MSAARERAGRALYERFRLMWAALDEEHRDGYRKDADIAHRASLDETDPALVEAIAASLTAGDYDRFSDQGKKVMRQSAQRAIIAARNHITGGGA